MLLSATSNGVGVNVRLVGYGLSISRYQGIFKARLVQGLLARYVPDPCMHQSVCFMVGVWVVLGMVVGPVLGTGIPIVVELIL